MVFALAFARRDALPVLQGNQKSLLPTANAGKAMPAYTRVHDGRQLNWLRCQPTPGRPTAYADRTTPLNNPTPTAPAATLATFTRMTGTCASSTGVLAPGLPPTSKGPLLNSEWVGSSVFRLSDGVKGAKRRT